MGFWSVVGGIALDIAKKVPGEIAKRNADLGSSIEKLGDSATDRQKEMLSEIRTRQADAEERMARQAERKANQAERKARQEEERKAKEEAERD